MKQLNFPLLNKDQIEVRVGQVSAKGCTFLLYKTSRTDAEILDKVVGQGNWQKRFYTLQGVGVGEQVRSIVVCSVGIYDDDKKEWIWKDDSGTESQVEQDKGVCSDAFKRASGGSCWGIGRELYYTGFIFAKVPTQAKTNGKGYELADKYASFEVKEISWNENPLSLKSLVIVDNNGQVVFSKGNGAKVSQNVDLTPKNTISANEQRGSIDKDDLIAIQTIIDAITNETKRQNFYTWLNSRYGTMNPEFLTLSQGKEVLATLGGKK